ncbi:uncharacterized protein LOC124280546 [Haliotis rubra]|uniref:uncharacterized protein LOC124280546 n=1 Tax=Haliotis rubra TaxID=36100 RepID=UPI001EE594CD|nr:uncharacterized protein LOC124280546 [Haliotis rubra]
MDWNCIMFEYECVDDNQILNFTGDSTLKGSQVFLLHNQPTHSVNNSYCVAYTCGSSIDVKLVGNTVNSSSCTLVLSEEGGRHADHFRCNYPISNNTLFQSNSSKIDIYLNMTASIVTSDKGLLWIRVTASNGGPVSVACGSKLPSDVTQDCPKVTTTPPLVPTVMTAIADTSDTPTLGSTHAKTPSVAMIPQATESNTPIIGGVVGGLAAVLCLSAISIAIYKKCFKTNKVEDESALAAHTDAPYNDLPKTPDSRRVWADSASSAGVGQGSPPAPFGAASHLMPPPANSLPPIRHIDLKI